MKICDDSWLPSRASLPLRFRKFPVRVICEHGDLPLLSAIPQVPARSKKFPVIW